MKKKVTILRLCAVCCAGLLIVLGLRRGEGAEICAKAVKICLECIGIGWKKSRIRTLIQILSACFFNGFAAGFLHRTIFTGSLKQICVPVLNCYSCPGALGACPIGALQTVAAGKQHSISFYALGMMTLFGVIFGRLICGFLCPFGLVQDLLARIPVRKFRVPEKADRILRLLKYAILIIMVLLLPAVVKNDFGTGEPWFCKWFCPAGTLEGGIPHLLMNPQLRAMAGALFSWKAGVLAAILLGAIFVPRVFCRYFCPLGAFYSLFQRFSLYQLQVDSHRCIGCGKCKAVCPMAVKMPEQPQSPECIRCGKCSEICPAGAIRCGFGEKIAETPDSAEK